MRSRSSDPASAARAGGAVLGLAVLVTIAEMSLVNTFNQRSWTQMAVKGAFFAAIGMVGLVRNAGPWITTDRDRGAPRLLLALMVWALVSSLWSPIPLVTAATAISSILILVYCRSVPTESLMPSVYAGLTAIIVLSALVYLLVPHNFEMLTGYPPVIRTRGILGHPNALGRACVACMGLSWLWYRQVEGGRWWLAAFGLVVSGWLLYATDSRGALLSLIGALGVVAIARSRRPRLVITILVALLVAAIISITTIQLVDQFQFLSRHAGTEDLMTISGRTYIWKFVVGEIQKAPLLGHGYRASEALLPLHLLGPAGRVPHPHNMYLGAAYSMGVFAAIALIWLLAKMTWAFGAAYHRTREPEYAGWLALITMIAVNGLVERSGFGNTTLFFVLLCGAAVRAGRLEPAEDEP